MAVKFNKGDVAEGILASAITARFLSKTKPITAIDVRTIVRKLKPAKQGFKGYTSITKFPSENRNPDIIDTCICKINLAEVNMKAFQSPEIYTDIDVKKIVNAAVAYANSQYVRKWAEMVYENDQKNTIEILSEGLLDQTGTKVDLKIKIDGKQVGIGISLKAGDVKQFGQVGGVTWDAMNSLFSPLGVEFSDRTRDTYTEMVAEKKLAPALTFIYKEAYSQLKKKDEYNLSKDLADFMKHHATSGEKDVAIVQLNKSEAKIYDFELLQSKLVDRKLDVRLTSGTTQKLSGGGYKGSSSIPKMEFLVDNQTLVSIRLKLEGNRVNSKGKRLPLVVRSYVEKGKMTTRLIT